MEKMRFGSRRARGKRWRMRIVTGGAHLAFNRAQFPFPVTAGTPMHASFPVSVGWTMTTATQGRAFHDFQMPAVAGLEQFQVGLIMAVETIVVAIVPPMRHHNIVMLLWHDDVAFGVQFQFKRLVFFVAGVALEA